MDYNTDRNKLIMSEYGRGIQQMVEYCKTISNRDERLQCAKAIISTMADMVEQNGDAEDFQQKLWNHLARISNY
ncbi:MAG: DUF4290 domain-containing protein [Bacteroidaceae bacterium]|nr:DUF4290 domain-containing protein [Bacteroidaceae bacterium]